MTGVVHSSRAFEQLKSKPAPAWGFWVVLGFNLIISATTVLALVLLGRPPMMESWLTFLPTGKYLLAEMFFLPPLRVLVWLLGAGAIHLGLRLAGRSSDFDQILNIGGLGTLIVAPFVLLSDWLLIALNFYPLAEYTHPLAALWGLILTAVGLKTLLGVKSGLAYGMALAGTLVSIPFLAFFAR